MGLLLLRGCEQGGGAEGKDFRAKEAEAFPAGKLGFFPCMSQNGCSGVLWAPFFQAGGVQTSSRADIERKKIFILWHQQETAF